MSSGKKKLTLTLVPTPKLVRYIRTLRRDIFLVQFKLEAGVTKVSLIEKAYASMQENRADLVVANDLDVINSKKPQWHIVDREKRVLTVLNRRALADRLAEYIQPSR